MIENNWYNFMFRNKDKKDLEFSVWDILRFKVEFESKEDIEAALSILSK